MQRTLKKIMGILCFSVGHFGFSSCVLANDSVERIFWDKTPLKISLPVGSERMITFPSPVRIGLPSELNNKLRTQINNTTVYWLAHEDFTAQRIEIRAIAGDVIYLVDLQAKKTGASGEPIEILLKNTATDPVVEKAISGNADYSASPSYILLSRFAAQQLYSPARLLKTPQGVHRVPINRDPIRHLIHGAHIAAKPIAAWGNGFLYVTAIELKNLSHLPLSLDPRKIRGQWLTATFQHGRLQAQGSEADTSALYLISNRPFHEVL